MSIAFTSRRPFNDGPLKQPLPENDQVNMAYILQADYFSFLTLKKLSPTSLATRLSRYTTVFVPIDVRDFDTVRKIAAGCLGRYVIYSEGGIADYQLLTPTNQLAYLDLLRNAKAVFLYWEKYIPFFQSITSSPVFYLPYPFFTDQTDSFRVPVQERVNRISLPSGLTGATRNGLCSLLAARQLLVENVYDGVDCWLAPGTFLQDAKTVHQVLVDEPLLAQTSTTVSTLRGWLIRTRLDYRPLMNLQRKLRARLFPKARAISEAPSMTQGPVTLLRRRNWPDYLARLGQNRLVLDLNNRPTVGRNALDCAALGIPCVSTAYSDLQPKLFPQTTLQDSWDIPLAVEICRQLQDGGFYEEVIQEASRHLKAFLPDAFENRLDRIRGKHPELLETGGR